MPDPNKKISAPTLDACERNVICAGTNISTENIQPEEKPPEPRIPIEECINPCAKETVKEATVSAKPKAIKTSAKESKEGSAAKSKKKSKTVKQKPAVVIEELCPPAPTCQMARPEIIDPKARVETSKPGCIDFEKCDDKNDDDDDDEEPEKAKTGCQNFEDCKDLAREEKKKLKEQTEKQTKKEKAQKVADEKPCPK